MSSSLTKTLMYGRSFPPSNSFGPMDGNCRTRSSRAAWTVVPDTVTSVCPPVCSRSGDGISTLTAIVYSEEVHHGGHRDHREEGQRVIKIRSRSPAGSKSPVTTPDFLSFLRLFLCALCVLRGEPITPRPAHGRRSGTRTRPS